MAIGDFGDAYDELSSLHEARYIGTDEEAVKAVADAVLADDELRRWWKFAEEYCRLGHAHFETALEEQAFLSLETFPCYSSLKGAHAVRLQDLRGADSLSDEVLAAARYVVNRAAFMACGVMWIEEFTKNDINMAGFKIAQPFDYSSAASDGGRKMLMSFKSDDWDYRGQRPGDFYILLSVTAPDFETLSKLPCSQLPYVHFDAAWSLEPNKQRQLGGSDALRGWNWSNNALGNYHGFDAHAPIYASWQKLRNKLTKAIDDMTDDLKQNQVPVYWIDLNPDLLKNDILKGSKSEREIKDVLSMYDSHNEELQQYKRIGIAPLAIEVFVVDKLLDKVYDHEWTTTPAGDKMIKLDVDMDELKDWTKCRNLL